MTRALIVEDKEENLYYLRALLEGNGWVVDSACHGAEALVKARQSPPDVIISDLLMPVMDGYSLLRRWKADARLKDIPFIVYTATYTEEEDERLAMDLGADAFILKPSEPQDFIARLCEVQANAGAAKPALPHQPSGDENTLLRYYSETLIHKLEDKTLQLEEANRALRLELAERRSVEEELGFKNRILQTQQETSLDAIMVVGENGKVLTFNRKFIELWGLPPQIINTHVDEFVLPFAAGKTEDPEAFISKVKFLYAHRDEQSQDELHLKDGRIVDRFSAPIAGEGGKYYGRIWYFRDVTERKKALSELKESESWFRSIFENVNTGIVSIDSSGKLTSFNEAFSAMLGYDAEALKGMHVADFTHSDDFKLQAVFFDEILDGKRNHYHITKRYIANHGRILWADVSAAVIRDADGQAANVVAVIQDITERKLAESAFEELSRKTEQRERMLSTALAAMSDFAQIYDIEGRVLYVNQPLLDLWGITLKEAVGKNFFDLGYPDDLAVKLQRQLQHVFETGQRVTDETPFTSADGELGYYEYIFSPVLEADGSAAFVVGSTRNISERKRSQAALTASELRYHSLFENMLEGYAYCRAIFEQDQLLDFVYIEVNSAFEKLTGLKDVAGKKVSDVIPQVREINREIFEVYARVVLTGKPEKFETYVAGLDIWLSLAVYSHDKEHFVAVFDNITQRKDTEARIRYLNRVYAVLSGINELIVRANDRDRLFREACRIAVEAGGFRMAMICILDRNDMHIVPVASAGKDEKLMGVIKEVLSSSDYYQNTMIAQVIREKQIILSNDSQSDPRVVFRKEYAESGVRSMAVFPLIVSDEAVGTLALYASEVEFFHEGEVQLLTELAMDIAFAIDHISKQERLNYLAYFDALTGLANRSLFFERVGQFIRSAESGGHKLALLLIDLERFKNINDSLGRPAGDELLKQVAEWLKQNLGEENLLARLDADHFAVVMPKVKQEGNLTKLLDKKSKAFLDHPFHLNDAVFRISAKAGIALFPDDGTDVNTLFNNAEAALKVAKRSGDRYLFHTMKMTEAVAGKLTLENQLRRAIDNEEFVLHYQPKVNLVSGKVVGAEALIRWNDPRTGLVPPGRFIPILEETGLIYDVGRWALRQAIADYLRWRAAGLAAVRIAVNVSPLQLRNPGFAAEIERKIGINAHAAEGLELEITESMIMEDLKHNVASLQAIRAMGVTVAIDDFGTGFSSLGYLAKLPADTLKIDRSFVVEMTAGPEGLALVSTIIDLAHALKFKVVAEGVETEEQANLLRLLSCDEMQGYLFSKPVPVDDFEKKFLGRT